MKKKQLQKQNKQLMEIVESMYHLLQGGATITKNSIIAISIKSFFEKETQKNDCIHTSEPNLYLNKEGIISSIELRPLSAVFSDCKLKEPSYDPNTLFVLKHINGKSAGIGEAEITLVFGLKSNPNNEFQINTTEDKFWIEEMKLTFTKTHYYFQHLKKLKKELES